MLATGKSLDVLTSLMIAVGENMVAEIGQNAGCQTGLMSQGFVLASISSISASPHDVPLVKLTLISPQLETRVNSQSVTGAEFLRPVWPGLRPLRIPPVP